ncbi:MAG: aminotransferase class IV [Breznakibacter sp.]
MQPLQDTLCIVNGKVATRQQLPEIAPSWLNVYEVVRAQQQVVLFAEDHFERFCKSLHVANKPVDIRFSAWHNQLDLVLQANHMADNNIRIDRYYHADRLIYDIITPVASKYPDSTQRRTGVTTILQFDERHNPNAKITDLKVRGKANEIIAETGIFETLLVNHSKEITEGSRSNFFAIRHNKLITAPDHMVLQGIMRKKLLEICHSLMIEIELRPIRIDELNDIDGAFLTGTSPRVLAVSSIDKIRLSPSHPIIVQLYNAIEKLVENYIQKVLGCQSV